MNQDSKPAIPETRKGDILAADDLEAIVNPVNCVGVMGKGLARQFAGRYPQILPPYKTACRKGELTISRPQLVAVATGNEQPRYVVNLATKVHWKNPSRLEWIDQGLASMYRQLEKLRIASVGIPALGAGLGGLPWSQVAPLIVQHAAQHPTVRTVVYAPGR